MLKMHLILIILQSKLKKIKIRFFSRFVQITIIRKKHALILQQKLTDFFQWQYDKFFEKQTYERQNQQENLILSKKWEKKLKFCFHYKNWILKNWKNVIWTDKISVVLLHHHGEYWVWHISKKALIKSCIHERWKDYSEFMFWSFFSYDKKKSCHIWKSETAAEKKKAEKKIAELNKELKPIMHEEWKLITAEIDRLSLQSQPESKSTWRWNKINEKLTRCGSNEINWYCYQICVLVSKFLSFAKKCMTDWFETIVQEDKTLLHTHYN